MEQLEPAATVTETDPQPARPRLDPQIETELPALRQRLLRHARFALHDASLAEDLVQDTLIVVIEQQDRRRGEASLATWATAILKHKIADWYRSPSRRQLQQLTSEDEQLDQRTEARFDPSRPDVAQTSQQPENREEQRQLMTALERCLGCLSRQTERVFMMREWLGFETAEICQRAGISAENCRTLLHRARTALRGCMKRGGIATGVRR